MSEQNDEAKKETGCCGGHGHGEGGCCCGGHGHGHGEGGGCCGGHGRGHGEDGGCCGGHGHGNDGGDGEEAFDFNAPLPKPTLITIATTFAQQAMVAMGILPNPITGKSVFMLNQAAHLIDAVDLLIEKTEGNRTEIETRTLDNIAHELRMLYVAADKEKTRREADGAKDER